MSAACEKIYTIVAEVIKKVINDQGLGCWWGRGGVDMGFGTYVLGESLCRRCVETATSTAKAFFHTNGVSDTVKRCVRHCEIQFCQSQ